MQDFIEVFSTSNPQAPYYAIVWRAFSIGEVVAYRDLADVATYCMRRALPVVAGREETRHQLRQYDIAPWPFASKVEWPDAPEEEPEPTPSLTSRALGEAAPSPHRRKRW